MKVSKFLLGTSIVIILGAIIFFGYRWITFPKNGWKVFNGCVSQNGTEVNYRFYGLDEWELLTEDMGCGKKYTGVESFGLKNKKIGNEINNID